MSDQINITFECKNCGAKPATLELPDDHTDNDIAKCKGCGFEFGPYGEIKVKAMEMAKAEVSGMVKAAFKGLKGFKIK
ncbi:hypothetical protein [uncultured Tateyamaria sp.]|uniref:hypothetical protein n=1 Tax=uncultured Tateyamaria sp. TaxID=455651 RepID=UPI002610037B|nr:hypothetical protein [uncultured Tateyamaria sp.]